MVDKCPKCKGKVEIIFFKEHKLWHCKRCKKAYPIIEEKE